MFIDASAMVSIITHEDGFLDLARQFSASSRRLTSAVAVYEAVLAVARKKETDIPEAANLVDEFLAEAGAALVPIGRAEVRAALEALARYGKGRHPARLNMGDCFAYACARTHGARLLYKGQDFTLTDADPG